MGSSASKSCEPDPPTPPAAGHRRSYSRNVFQSSCIRPASGSPDGSDIDDEDDEEQAPDRWAKGNDIEGGCGSRPKGTRKPKAQRAAKTCELLGASSLARTVSGHGGGSGRFLSRLGLFNGSLSSRLNGPTRAHSDSSSDTSDPRGPVRNGPRGDPYPRGNVSGHDERRDVEAHEPAEPNFFIEARETGSHVPISTTSSGDSPSGPLFGDRDLQAQNTRARGARYIDLLEHRSNFIERRRRLRSQVRALQRMGSRFESPSGHERACILSGQHRRDQSDGAHARARISRIVVLAEALFEVLDEIHQQSVVLSSRSPLSSIGSVPAPNEAVEALPVKLHQKSPKQEDAQCYICLVEYEDGDEVRVLPCRHEFHKSCVDKWLVDIHRICPLCRGDVCKTDRPPAAAS